MNRTEPANFIHDEARSPSQDTVITRPKLVASVQAGDHRVLAKRITGLGTHTQARSILAEHQETGFAGSVINMAMIGGVIASDKREHSASPARGRAD